MTFAESWPWIIGALLFTVWFTVFEAIALHNKANPGRIITLSRFVWTIGQHWHLFLVIWGMVIGGLSVHFFWNWCPDLGSVNGWLNLSYPLILS